MKKLIGGSIFLQFMYNFQIAFLHQFSKFSKALTRNKFHLMYIQFKTRLGVQWIYRRNAEPIIKYCRHIVYFDKYWSIFRFEVRSQLYETYSQSVSVEVTIEQNNIIWRPSNNVFVQNVDFQFWRTMMKFHNYTMLLDRIVQLL